MRVPRVYADMPMESGQLIELPPHQSNYLCKALRMQSGRELWLFNGQGGAFYARLELADAKRAQVLLKEFDDRDRESPLSIELGIGLSKGDRFDWVVQKATELGITKIQPLITERVEVRLSKERAQKKLDHWQGIIISACEQSGRNRIPSINHPMLLSDWLGDQSAPDKFVLDPLSEQPLSKCSIEGANAKLLVGPEGGLSEEEIALAIQKEFQGVSLGPRVLRTETAPLAAISLMQALWGDV